MRKPAMFALIASCAATPVLAGEMPRRKIDIFERPSYDRKLEQAVMRIVAGRIGDIRGPLKADVGPLLVALDNERAWNAAASSLMTAPLPLRLAASTY
ncbi:hypothetical protein [Mesorhizobium sp. ZC-5]|uniref:hypothetical protein n=1 Tax=Mesorhizobium sp. ZC-5 TaxID=2986066 RepID=UPI0021E744A5|nr:hypothetical protein [Mesorhizobium sp. ZC-5]MCV3243774.1 hypothetical protein [Mesorhizobium sp. ZC-5]